MSGEMYGVEDKLVDAGYVDKGGEIETNIPARMDRLPWGRWHWFVCLALGISWVLDGIEVTTAGIVGNRLQNKHTLGISERQVGLIGSIYVCGAVIGALFFGVLADKWGRKKLFVITPMVYLSATFCSALAWDYPSYAMFEFFTGFGIGGEYSAMNSAINEFIPARVRGIVDLAINGTYWMGAAFGAAASILFLNTTLFPVNIGWRMPSGIGALLGIAIVVLRFFLPESPRWLMTHGKAEQAEAIVKKIERSIEDQKGTPLETPENYISLKKQTLGFFATMAVIVKEYKQRAFLAMCLMVSQAFFYNAIFFTYSLILTDYYDVGSSDTGLYLIPFAIGNFLGSVTIGRLFDTIGRKPMIFLTYSISAILLLGTGLLFVYDFLSAVTQTLCWSVVFFFSSAGSSSAYLTISEIFPLEVRALAIAIFYSFGTAGGGLLGPVLFGELISSRDRWELFYGYVLGCALMMGAAVVTLFFGVNAEGKSLEEVAPPVNRGGGVQFPPSLVVDENDARFVGRWPAAHDDDAFGSPAGRSSPFVTKRTAAPKKTGAADEGDSDLGGN